MSSKEKYEKYLKEVAAMNYCCAERRRLYVDCRYASLSLDNDTHYITCFGTQESDGDWEGCGFQMNFCPFCGKKLGE